ncbi:unnamed protein product, partial [Meganyctiphanes norvegica]
MKVRIKYSSTQKFILNLEHDTLGHLKHDIRNFVQNTYDQNIREPLTLSLNGKDPLVGPDDENLSNFGIVRGDLITVLTSPQQNASIPTKPQQAVHSAKPTPSTSCNEALLRKDEKKKETDVDQKLDENMDLEVCEDENSLLLYTKDGKPPNSVKQLFSTYVPTSKSQAVNLLVHLTMIECGFVSDSGDNQVPNGWKEMVSTFSYNHKSLSEFKCTLVLVTMGDVKQILASFPQQQNEISVKLNTGDYSKVEAGQPVKPESMVRIANLARTLRDRVLHPLQVAAHETLGIPAPWQLTGLPQELLLVITAYLDTRSVLNLSQTCQRLNTACSDRKLWQLLYKRDFSNLYNNSENINWKAKYQETYKLRKAWEDTHQQHEVFGPPPTGIPPAQIFPPDPLNPFPSPFPFSPGGLPRPRGPNPYPFQPQPHPQPNPSWDPDSPYFGGEIPPMPGYFPGVPDPFNPLGPLNPLRPRRPNNPMFPHNPRFGGPNRGPLFTLF